MNKTGGKLAKGLSRAGRPRILAAKTAEMEAADPSLHTCGCRCSPCTKARWCVQQLPRAIDLTWDISRPSSSESSSSNTTTSSDPASSGTTTASCSRAIIITTSSDDSSVAVADARTSTSTLCSDGSAVPPPPPASPSPQDAGLADVPPLDPLNKPTGAALLKDITGPDNRTVWRLPPSARWQHQVVVKDIPCHSAERAAEITAAGDLFETPSKRVAGILTVDEAMAEARMADEVSRAGAARSRRRLLRQQRRRDLFVQPLHVEVRPCSLVGTSLDAGHDLEVVIVYPYHADGDALQYMYELGRATLWRMLSWRRPLGPDVAAVVLSQAMYELARDMFGLVGQAHELGFILNDHKPENLVFSRSAGGYQLIDAEAVQRCAMRSHVPPERLARCTPDYAAPEQRARLWADARSDVYTCGRSVLSIIERCLVLPFREVLGAYNPEYQEVMLPLFGLLDPLMLLAESCTARDPAKRPTAAEAFDLLERWMYGMCDDGGAEWCAAEGQERRSRSE
ncbi:hypothetical protein PLESTM_001111200 [Pleodorina starrii]|nr:hypothetical protein PLESTM_001111200 [Pleodorina starrii]